MEDRACTLDDDAAKGSLKAIYNRAGLKRTVFIALRRVSTMPRVKKFLTHHSALTNYVDKTLQKFIRPRVAARVYPLAAGIYGLSWVMEPVLVGGLITFGAIASTTFAPTAMLMTTGFAVAWAFNLAVGATAAAVARYGFNIGARARRITNPLPKPRGLRIN